MLTKRLQARKYLKIRWDISFRLRYVKLSPDKQLDELFDQLIIKGSYHYQVPVS